MNKKCIALKFLIEIYSDQNDSDNMLILIINISQSYIFNSESCRNDNVPSKDRSLDIVTFSYYTPTLLNEKGI